MTELKVIIYADERVNIDSLMNLGGVKTERITAEDMAQSINKALKPGKAIDLKKLKDSGLLTLEEE